MDSLYVELAGLLAVIAIVKHAGEYFLKLAGERVTARVRKALFMALLQQNADFFDATPTGELVSILWSDVEAIHLAVATYLPDLTRFTISVVCSTIGMAVVSFRLTLVAALVAPVIGVLASAFGTYVSRMGREHQAQVASATSLATEGLSAAALIKAFGQEAWMFDRFSFEVDECARRALVEMRIHKCWNASNLLQMTGATLLLLRAASQALLRGQISVGEITTFGYLGMACGNAANDAANSWARTQSSAARGAKALSLLDEVAASAAATAHPAMKAASSLAQTLEAGRSGGGGYDVRLVDVHFAYGATTAVLPRPVLEGVCVEAAAKRITALVGPSGCGKSTVLGLVVRLYEPTAGLLQLGGIDVARLPLAWLRDQIAIVPQEPQLFRASFADNISFGATSTARSTWSTQRMRLEVEAAARAAGADAFIGDAGGFDAPVSERGGSLSGGQRQRIAIARALLRKPSVLLLDEATAALDNTSERRVMDALRTLATTILVVAHRLSTVEDADAIFVLEGGRVVERGTHHSLLQADGLYAELAKASS